MMDDGLLAALEADDARRFDPLAATLGQRLVPVLLEGVDEETCERAAKMMRSGGAWPRMDVGALLALGRPGLWIGTEWADRMLRGRRSAPTPALEQWDVLLSLHVERVEAAWLMAWMFASLDASQASLGRRMLLGIERRFGARGLDVLRLRAGEGPLRELVPRSGSNPLS